MAVVVDKTVWSAGDDASRWPNVEAGFGGMDCSSEMLQDRRIGYADIGIDKIVAHAAMLRFAGCWLPVVKVCFWIISRR